MPAIPEHISIKAVVVGTLVGAVLGAIASLALATMRSSGQEQRVTPGISNYLRLGLAMVMLARQTSELIAPPKRA